MTLTFVRRHRMVALGAALGLAFAAFLVFQGPAKPAGAALGDLSCTLGSGSITFNPGMSLTTHSSNGTITGNLGLCVSVSQPNITGGTFVVNGTGSGNCTTGGSATGTGTVTFNDPAHSTSNFNASLAIGFVLGIPTMRGNATLTGPTFNGDMALALPLTASFNPANCGLPGGLTSATYALATTTSG